MGHPDEVNEIFDHISYQKGACLIRMVSSYVGADKLSEGLQLYLKRHSFGNALTADLWAALAEVSGKPVCQRSWSRGRRRWATPSSRWAKLKLKAHVRTTKEPFGFPFLINTRRHVVGYRQHPT